MKIKVSPIIGLRTATPEDIENLKRKYPNGIHITHTILGDKLPHNGVFRTNKVVK